MNINREECCCFTGHRRIESRHLTLLRQKLQSEIASLAARKGVKAFMAGGALGFDTMAAQAVLWAREKQFPHLKLILALPCREQNARWSQKNSEIYYKILKSFMFLNTIPILACFSAIGIWWITAGIVCVTYSQAKPTAALPIR